VAKAPSYPWIEHHGAFRFRPDYYKKLDLGTFRKQNPVGGTSGSPPNLIHTESNRDDSSLPGDANSVWTANMRLRYEPTLHLSERIQLRLQADVLDNFVLGSNPDGALARPDVPMVVFSDSQQPSAAGVNDVRDTLRVKRAYAWWRIPFGELRVGRMPNHWGLGMVHNAGLDEDSDYGDSVDRFEFLTQLFGLYLQGSMDWISEGAITASAGEPFGQPRDLSQLDDADQWTFSVFRRPLSTEEQAKRAKRLDEQRKPVLDWGLRFTYRSQDYTTEMQRVTSSTGASHLEPLPARVQGVGTTTDAFDYRLYRRGATFYMPDLWTRFQWRPAAGQYLRLELETALVLAEINDSAADAKTPGTSYDLALLGLAAEGEYRYRSFSLDVKAGMATGGNQEGFGVQSGSRLPAADAAGVTSVAGLDLGSFLFDKAYVIDQLLFREVVGTVTNAWYLRPTVGYAFIDEPGERLGFEASFLFARALKAGRYTPEGSSTPVAYGTPSGEKNLGLELQAGLYFRQADSFTLRFDYGVLFPFAAFDYRSATTQEWKEADTAHTVQGRLIFRF